MSPKKPGPGVDADALVPNLRTAKKKAKRYPYWLGLRHDAHVPTDPNAPPACAGMAIGGMEFPLKVEDVKTDPNNQMNCIRTPRVGLMAMLTVEQLERIAAALPRLVLRRNVRLADGSLGFKKIAIPDERHQRAFEQSGQVWKQYKAHPADEPAANSVYCVPAIQGKRRSSSDLVPNWTGEPVEWDEHGDEPAPLSETGLAMPPETNGKAPRTRRPRTVALTIPELPKIDD